MMEPHYIAICEEHDVRLNTDGTCPKCTDGNGQPFVLDVQSYYLVTEAWWSIKQQREKEQK
jgi:hypothetical protein